MFSIHKLNTVKELEVLFSFEKYYAFSFSIKYTELKFFDIIFLEKINFEINTKNCFYLTRCISEKYC